MVEGCPIPNSCRLVEEPYGFLVDRFKKSDDLSWRTVRAFHTDLARKCLSRNGTVCPAGTILRAIAASRQS